MTMDLTQASQMLKWLDEERRSDKAAIAALQERVQSQQQQLAQQEQQLNNLQESIASLEVLLSHASEISDSVDQLRADVNQMLEEQTEQRRKEQREAERMHRLEIGALKDEVAQISEKTQRIQPLVGRMDALQLEDRRLNEIVQRLEEAVADLDKQSENRYQTVTYLEEQRRADNRRLTALEAETTDLRKRIEATSAKIPLLEETIQKEQARLEEGLEEIKAFEPIIEELRVADFRREQRVKKWSKQAEEVRQEMEELRREKQGFLHQFQQTKQALDRLEDFRARIETQQNEVAEMQRLAEERIKRQWEEWQANLEKEYQSWMLQVEEEWKHQERTNKDHAEQLEQLEEAVTVNANQLGTLWKTLSSQGHMMLEAVQDRVEALEETISKSRGH